MEKFGSRRQTLLPFRRPGLHLRDVLLEDGQALGAAGLEVDSHVGVVDFLGLGGLALVVGLADPCVEDAPQLGEGLGMGGVRREVV